MPARVVTTVIHCQSEVTARGSKVDHSHIGNLHHVILIQGLAATMSVPGESIPRTTDHFPLTTLHSRSTFSQWTAFFYYIEHLYETGGNGSRTCENPRTKLSPIACPRAASSSRSRRAIASSGRDQPTPPQLCRAGDMSGRYLGNHQEDRKAPLCNHGKLLEWMTTETTPSS